MDWEHEWFVRDVAREILAKGFMSPDYTILADALGFESNTILHTYPDAQKLSFSLIDHIFKPYKQEIFRIAKIKEDLDSEDRLVEFLTAGFDYYYEHPMLAQVIINAMYSTNDQIREYLHKSFREVVDMLVEDLLDAQIIPLVSSNVIFDLIRVLLSILFLGKCPELRMEYLSYVENRLVAISALKAMRIRYHSTSFSE
jgi:hypothetical protein